MLIRTLRLERTWTQEQLAVILGVNVRTVQRLEGGAVQSLETAQALAGAFDCEARLFLMPETVSQSTPAVTNLPLRRLPPCRPVPATAGTLLSGPNRRLYAPAFMLIGGAVASIVILMLLIAGTSWPALTAAFSGLVACLAIGLGPALGRRPRR